MTDLNRLLCLGHRRSVDHPPGPGLNRATFHPPLPGSWISFATIFTRTSLPSVRRARTSSSSRDPQDDGKHGVEAAVSEGRSQRGEVQTRLGTQTLPSMSSVTSEGCSDLAKSYPQFF